MNFNEFRMEMKDFSIFTLNDVNKLKERVYHHRLIEWQKKGYIKRISNGVYMFSEVKLNEDKLFYIANRLYEPSYVSLEAAFSYYSLIPEVVYTITSVSSKKTTSFKTNYAAFNYRKVKSNLMFGYTLIRMDNINIKIAEPEKAILDFIYLNSEINSLNHIEELRLNTAIFEEKINRDKLNGYLSLFNNKRLNRRLNLLLKWVDNAKLK